ncbi:MAG: ShlB/FhaC/HecB family hemolysin secretion/activation protein [Rickettsiales bacterium]
MVRRALQYIILTSMFMLVASGAAIAAPTVPGAADAARVEPIVLPSIPTETTPAVMPETPAAPALVTPEGAQQVSFILHGFDIAGATAFTPEELAAPYADRIGQSVTLAEIYAMADALGARYREAGFFLSRVMVPDQHIDNGIVHITIIEGYIDQVLLNEPEADNHVVRGYINRIREEKPLRASTLEHALLSLSDLPGQRFRAVLSAMPEGTAGASMLTLIPIDAEKVSGSVGIDNYGSKFLGPQQVSANISASLLPLQQTSIYGLTSMPTKELGYGMVNHSIVVAPDVTVAAQAGLTKARPGYTLKPLDIDSTSTALNLSIKYQWVRQRDQNLSTALSLEGRNISSDLSGATLTREHVRVTRLTAAYDIRDAWKGSNGANMTLSQGINGLGSSKKGDLNLSRGQAEPDFFKAELALSRLQEITPTWSALVQVSGQISSGPLYSSEEFGYGGQSFGRAYDTSEIVGDEGVAGSLELRYGGWRDLQPINLEPYAFYDIGVVTNEDIGQSARDSASSAGVGVRFATVYGQSGNIGIAMPLTRDTLAPIYGGNPSSPRLMLQIRHVF